MVLLFDFDLEKYVVKEFNNSHGGVTHCSNLYFKKVRQKPWFPCQIPCCKMEKNAFSNSQFAISRYLNLKFVRYPFLKLSPYFGNGNLFFHQFFSCQMWILENSPRISNNKISNISPQRIGASLPGDVARRAGSQIRPGLCSDALRVWEPLPSAGCFTPRSRQLDAHTAHCSAHASWADTDWWRGEEDAGMCRFRNSMVLT